MECELFKDYEEPEYVLVMGKVLRLEVADEVLSDDGGMDIHKAKPLMMTGNSKGMHFCTLKDIDVFEPFSAMFLNGSDPLVKKYSD